MMLYTKYESPTPSSFREKNSEVDLFGPVFQLVIPQGGAQFWPQGHEQT